MNRRATLAHRAGMTTILALALLAAAPQVNADPPRDPPLTGLKWEVYWGLTGGVRPDTFATPQAGIGGGGGSLLGVNRQLFSFLRAELAVGLGAYTAPVDVVTLIRLGARLEWPGLGRWHPFVGVYFAHQHESGWEHVKSDPIPAVIGLSEHHVNHRSGIETGLGVAYDLRGRKGLPVGGRIGVKASVTHLLGAGAPRYVELTTLVGLIF
jgi:hypothetical protein